MRRARMTAAVAAVLLSVAGAGADDVFVSGRVERISSPSGVGGGGGIEWNHAASPRQTLSLGFAGYALPGTTWVTGRGATTASLGGTSVTADLMGGHSSVEGGFYQIGGGASHPLGTPRLVGDAECHYLGGTAARGTLAKAGLTFAPRPSLILQGGYYQSFGGTLGSRLAAAKMVYIAGRWRYLVGGSLGRSSPTVFGFVDQQQTQDVRHAFAGATLPLGEGGELTIVLEHYDLEVANRSLLSLIWKMAHRRKGP
jgi:hypothetical protein